MKAAVLRQQQTQQTLNYCLHQVQLGDDMLAQWEALLQEAHWDMPTCTEHLDIQKCETNANGSFPMAVQIPNVAAGEQFFEELPSPMSVKLSPPVLPSLGSSLHKVGKCRPCAWFWKPQGCQNGQECAHCHLCPVEEIKSRKRVKDIAMRSGALRQCVKAQMPDPGALSRLLRVSCESGVWYYLTTWFCGTDLTMS